MSFQEATFSGDVVYFTGATFVGGNVGFAATFSDLYVYFIGATFSVAGRSAISCPPETTWTTAPSARSATKTSSTHGRRTRPCPAMCMSCRRLTAVGVVRVS
jgi:hypothetical protein